MSVATFAHTSAVEAAVRDLDYSLSGLLLTVTEEDLIAVEWTGAMTEALERLRERLRRSEGFPSDGPPTPH